MILCSGVWRLFTRDVARLWLASRERDFERVTASHAAGIAEARSQILLQLFCRSCRIWLSLILCIRHGGYTMDDVWMDPIASDRGKWGTRMQQVRSTSVSSPTVNTKQIHRQDAGGRPVTVVGTVSVRTRKHGSRLILKCVFIMDCFQRLPAQIRPDRIDCILI